MRVFVRVSESVHACEQVRVRARVVLVMFACTSKLCYGCVFVYKVAATFAFTCV